MRRSVDRTRNLVAFSIDVGELGVLVSKLVGLFEKPCDCNVQIHIDLSKSERLTFQAIDEIAEYKELTGTVSKFEVKIYQGGRYISISSNSIFKGVGKVTASAEDEPWCAAAVEAVHTFAILHKQWYSPIVTAPIGRIMFLVANVPTALLILPSYGYRALPWISNAMYALAALLLVVFIWGNSIFPAGLLRITEKDTFLKKNHVVITVICVFITAIGALGSWLLPLNH